MQTVRTVFYSLASLFVLLAILVFVLRYARAKGIPGAAFAADAVAV